MIKQPFKIQISMLADTINTAFGGSIKTVTNVRTIAEALNQSNIVRGMLNEVDTQFKYT